MRCIVMTGVPGAGKTFHRELHLSHLPHVDIKDVYDAVGDISWDAAVLAMLVKAAKLFVHGASEVVLEGMFLPGTPSRKLLERELESMRIDATFILKHQSYWVCRECIIRSSEGYEQRTRLEILDLYWDRAEALAEEEKRGDDD